MGSKPKTVRPAPAPPPIPPASSESEDVKLAREAQLREQKRKKDRRSTLITPTTKEQLTGQNKDTLG